MGARGDGLRACNSHCVSAQSGFAGNCRSLVGPVERMDRQRRENTGGAGGIAALGFLLVGGASFAATGGTEPVMCAGLQHARVAEDAAWRCQAVLQANHSYLARVDHQTRNVTLELIGPDSKRVLKVDSPTHRAGPELLFYSPRASGRYVLALDVSDRSLPPRVIDLQFREVKEATPGTALARGLAALTSVATVTDEPPAEHRRITTLRSALPHLRAARAHDLEGEALFRIAHIHFWGIGEWKRAAAAAEEAAHAFDRVPDPVMAAQATTLRAESLIESAGPVQSGSRPAPKSGRTQFDEAEHLLEESARRFRARGLKFDEASVINYLGVSSYYQGRLADARRHYAEAVRMFAELGESVMEVQSLQNLALLDHDGGDYIEAANAYRRLLNRLDPASNRRNYLAILVNLAVAQYALGHTGEALQNLLTALPLTEGPAELSDRARTLHFLGRTYLTLGERERAEVFLVQALELQQSDPVRDRQGLLTSLIINGDLHRDDGAIQRSLRLHLQALDHAVAADEKASVLLAIGKDHMAAGSVSAAIDTYQRALKLDLPDDSPKRISVTAAHGYALSRQGAAEGRALLLKAARAHQVTGDDDLAAEAYYRLASEERRAGQIASALRSVGQAIALHDAQRIRAVNPDLRATFISNRAAAYELQADLYMAQWQRASNRAERERLASAAIGSAETLRLRALEDFRQIAQAPARQRSASDADALLELDARLAAKRHRLSVVLDQDHPSAEQLATLRREIALLRTELDVAQQKQGSGAGKARPRESALSVPELQRALPEQAVLLTWLLGDERSWIWCITRAQASAFPLGAGDDIEAAARELHELWSRPPRGAPDRERELEASRTILGAGGALVAQMQQVTVIADGALRAIPFGALWVERRDGEGTRRLAETAAVSYQPALQSWGRSPAMAAKAQPRILLVGDPVLLGESRATQGVADFREAPPARTTAEFRRLPASRREVDSIVRIGTDWESDVLLGDAATKDRLLALPLGNFRVLHFATHARLDVHDPQLSSIMLSSRPADVGHIGSALSLREVVGLGLNADTVVLSACEGALGKEYRGQLSFGLSEAFLLAGASNVLGSLWRVSDVATEKYMRSFYRHYMNRGQSSVGAARSAAREMMADPAYAHPFYWAAFVVLTS